MTAKKLALPVAVMLRVALCYGSTQRIGNNKIFFSPILLHRALVVIQSLNRLCQCQLYLFRALYSPGRPSVAATSNTTLLCGRRNTNRSLSA